MPDGLTGEELARVEQLTQQPTEEPASTPDEPTEDARGCIFPSCGHDVASHAPPMEWPGQCLECPSEPSMRHTFRNFRALAESRPAPETMSVEAKLREHILDIAAHATPYGNIPSDPGWVGTYLLSAGALHRAIGTIGHTAPSCEAEAALANERAGRERAEERVRESDAEVIRRLVCMTCQRVDGTHKDGCASVQMRALDRLKAERATPSQPPAGGE